MFQPKSAFNGASIKDVASAKTFYADTLGLDVHDDEMGLTVKLPGGGQLYLYPKGNHQPATFTILNFVVDDIDTAAVELEKRGVKFERYEGMHQDEKGIARGIAANMGPDIAWFTDPSGNILAVLQEPPKK